MTAPREPSCTGTHAVLRNAPDGVFMRVRLTPKASRDGIDGCENGPDGAFLKARVRAVPERGKANAALLRLIAKTFDLRLSDMTLRSGQSARMKSVHIAGAPDELTHAMAAKLGTLAEDAGR